MKGAGMDPSVLLYNMKGTGTSFSTTKKLHVQNVTTSFSTTTKGTGTGMWPPASPLQQKIRVQECNHQLLYNKKGYRYRNVNPSFSSKKSKISTLILKNPFSFVWIRTILWRVLRRVQLKDLQVLPFLLGGPLHLFQELNLNRKKNHNVIWQRS